MVTADALRAAMSRSRCDASCNASSLAFLSSLAARSGSSIASTRTSWISRSVPEHPIEQFDLRRRAPGMDAACRVAARTWRGRSRSQTSPRPPRPSGCRTPPLHTWRLRPSRRAASRRQWTASASAGSASGSCRLLSPGSQWFAPSEPAIAVQTRPLHRWPSWTRWPALPIISRRSMRCAAPPYRFRVSLVSRHHGFNGFVATGRPHRRARL